MVITPFVILFYSSYTIVTILWSYIIFIPNNDLFNIGSYTNDDWSPVPKYQYNSPSRNAYWPSLVSNISTKPFQ